MHSPGSSATPASISTSPDCRCSTRRRCNRRCRRSFSAAMRRSDRRTSSGRSRTATTPRSRSTVSAAARTSPIRPPPLVNLMSQKMGIHEWSYDNAISNDQRFKVPLKDVSIALKNIKVEVELGFDAAQAFAEAQRCLNCDVQTVFTSKACIECDACVDICPMDCITFTDDGDETDLRTRLNAPSRNLTQDLYVAERAEDRARDGQGRGRLPALRAVRGALSDWSLGHAEVLPRYRASRPSLSPAVRERGRRATRRPWRGRRNEGFDRPDPGRQRLRRQVRQRQRLGLRVGEPAVRQGDPAHGHSGCAAQHFSVEHPGPADVVRSARQRGRLAWPARRRRHDGGDESADLGPGLEGDRAGRLPVLRFDQAAAGREIPRRHHRHRRAADRDLQPRIHRRPAAAAVQEHHLRRRAVGAARNRSRGNRAPDRRPVQGQGGAAQAQRARDDDRAKLCGQQSRLPAGHQGQARQRRRRAHFHRRQQRRGAGRRVRRRDGGRLVSDHAVVVDGRGVRAPLPQVPHRRGQRQGPLRDRAGRGRARLDRHRDRRGAGTARARSPARRARAFR